MRKLVSLSATAASALALSAVLLAGAADAAAPQSAPATAAVDVVRAADVTMVVSHSYAHLRKEPNTKSGILATLKKGTKVDVIEKVAGGKWAHVKVDKSEGYIAVALLK
ncbi:MAG TPA: SH3 domain-containing protein [Dongiaceae bacterium]|jgi:uncharacterized protein YgiM (DUF1202 family)|nr:SH3 domain-containing protein [Dongiaceae bacterium]